MVGTVPPAPQPHAAAAAALPSSSSADAAGGMASSAEEEAFRRNTDCVYFLASPLTCKKGSECEYRHSDFARMNPRDCWYWLHGNCLNPKCSFRHPPLDGLLGPQMPNSVGVSGPVSQPAITPTAPVAYSGKQGVACIFFQKGNCLKGDWCPFAHAPNSANNKVMQNQAAIPAIEPLMVKKSFGLEKCAQEKKASQTVLKPVEFTNQTKPINKVDSMPAKQEFGSKKNFHQSFGTVEELHGYAPIDVRAANDGNRVSSLSCVLQPLQVNSHATTALNGKDAEETSREPSPGFDVLVDNELVDSDYYHSKDQFGRARNHEGMIEYFDGQSGDYSSMVDTDRDVYRDSRAYDSYERLQGRYGREQGRSSERMSGGLTHQDRKRYGRADSPDQVDHSDLRHHLSKHRRVNGLRSVINHDYSRERPEERSHQGSRQDIGHDRERQETSFSSRLRGRIKIPGTSSSATDGNDMHLEREMERGRDRSRLSPGRSQVSSRLRDRIKGVVQEDMNNDGRNNRGPRIKMDSDNNSYFAAPKSLAELKSRKNADEDDQHMNDQQLMGKRKYSKIDHQRQSEEDLSFEGPKPLEEILKRKRGAETAGSESDKGSSGTEINNEGRNSAMSKSIVPQVSHLAASKNGSIISINKNEDDKPAFGVKSVSEGTQSADGKSLFHNIDDAEVEEGMMVEDGGEDDQEPGAYDHGDEEFDYQQGDGDNYNLDESENGDVEEDYLDDDDGDEFAKKMGVMY